jgi:hypothetical protein
MLGFAPIASTPLADDGKRIVQIGAVTVRGATAAVSTPAFGQTHGLTGQNATGPAALVDTGAITQTHGMSGGDITAASATVSTSTITQAHTFGAVAIRGAAAAVSFPAIGTGHALGAATVRGATAAVSTPAFGQTHELQGADVKSAPAVTGAALAQSHNLNNVTLRAQAASVDLGSLTQEHSLTGGNVSADGTVVSAPAFNIIVGLISLDVRSAPATVTQLELMQIHAFGAIAIRSAITLQSPQLVQDHALIGPDVMSPGALISSPRLRLPIIFDATSILGGSALVSGALYNIGVRRVAMQGQSLNIARPNGRSSNFARPT